MSKKNPIGESDFSLSCTHDMMNIAPFSNPILFSKKHNCKHSFYIINFIRCINFKPHFQLPLLTPEKESNQRGAAEIQAINSYEATVCVGWPSFDSIHMDPSCAGVNFLACCPYLWSLKVVNRFPCGIGARAELNTKIGRWSEPRVAQGCSKMSLQRPCLAPSAWPGHTLLAPLADSFFVFTLHPTQEPAHSWTIGLQSLFLKVILVKQPPKWIEIIPVH